MIEFAEDLFEKFGFVADRVLPTATWLGAARAFIVLLRSHRSLLVDQKLTWGAIGLKTSTVLAKVHPWLLGA